MPSRLRCAPGSRGEFDACPCPARGDCNRAIRQGNERTRRGQEMDPTTVLVDILLAGLMGMLGQGVRAIIGLKTMVDDANAQGVSSADLFRAARLLVSLMIGFIAGIA